MAYTIWDLFISRYIILINVYTYINDLHPHVKIALSCTCMCFLKWEFVWIKKFDLDGNRNYYGILASTLDTKFDKQTKI